MKKFLAIFTFVSVGMLSQAASVSWSSGNLKASLPADVSSVTAYYYVISDGTYGEYAQKSTEELNDIFVGKDGTLKEVADYTGTSVPAGLSINVNDTIDMAEYDPTLNKNDVYVAIVYVADSSFGGKYALTGVGEYHYADPELYPLGSANNINTAIGTDAIEYSTSNSWAAVPEPTTIAFLALGLAAIGLKRKVA
jgi:hypothetical protein